MNGPVPISSEIRAEAAAWLARLRADDRSAADEQGFHDWLAADPEHAAAFDAVDRVWAAVGGVGSSFGRILQEPRHEPSFLRRRGVLLSAVAVLAIGGISTMALRSASAHVYETGVGEQKHVSLEDGTLLFLDAQTRVSIAFSDKLRSVDMQFGRANFRVAADHGRPFVVKAAQRKIVADQCNFDVRCDGAKVQVVLIHGEADVHSTSSPDGAPATRMRGGERLTASADTEKYDRPRIAPLVAWQAGFEVFESKRLDEAAAEMNRYSDMKISVDPDIAGLKVSGVYRVGDNAAFANSIAKLLPIAVHTESDGLILAMQGNN